MKKIVIVLAVLCLMSVGAFAQCAILPCVVAATSIVKQTHGIAPTTVFTPTADGTFRVSAYLTTSKPTNPDAGDWELYFRWNDGLRANRWVENTASNPGSNAGVGTIVVHAIAGQPLEYRTQIVAGTAEGMKYSLYIVVEQLQ